MFICLSGQHEMTVEFGGFRGLLTRSGYPKPIFNAFSLASRLGTTILKYSVTSPDYLKAIPTKKPDGTHALLLVYSTDTLDESLEDATLTIDGMPLGKYRLSRIDKYTANGYSAYKALCPNGVITPSAQEIIEKSSHLDPKILGVVDSLTLSLSANSVVLLEQI